MKGKLVYLTDAEWRLVLQTVTHRRLQANGQLKADLAAVEKRLDNQLRGIEPLDTKQG